MLLNIGQLENFGSSGNTSAADHLDHARSEIFSAPSVVKVADNPENRPPKLCRNPILNLMHDIIGRPIEMWFQSQQASLKCFNPEKQPGD